MLWFVLAGMTGLAVLCALWPLAFRRKGGAEAASEVAFYQAQLGEIDRDVERGQLPAGEAAGARAEAGRRLIAASAAAPGRSGAGEAATPRRIGAALIVIVVPLVALALYADLGRPDMPDAPLAGRLADAKSADGVEAAIARLEAHLTASPDDAKGWAVIAPVYMHLGRFDDAVAAFGEILRLEGESATRRAAYGEALVGAAGGIVTADARAAFDKALADEPSLPAARFYLGLAAEQDGDKAKAIAIYQGLLSETPAEAPWAAALAARLAAVKGESASAAPASQAAASSQAPAAASSQAPAAASSAAAAGSDNDQQAQIRGMVERLATRLAQQGGDADAWGRLIRSYSVMREADKAREALATARKALAGDQSAGPKLEALAQQLGLEGGNASSAPAGEANAAPSAAPAAPAASSQAAAPAASSAAAAGSDDDQQAQIRGMVERLATRLAQSGGDADQWGRLIRSYAVLRQPDKAREALATARKALAGDQSAGPKLDALAQQLGLEGGNASSAPAGEANAAPSAAPAAPASQAPAATSQAPPATSQAPAAAAAGPDDAQQAMIRGMVERLATRLSQSGGDADQWGRLIRAYSVMHEPDKARDALAAARKALAGDAAAGPGLDALARELGIGG
jgi:cytochrome c-type biogenesis protein CcmH